MKCIAEPYEGNEKYIFISYCHKDKELVYPIAELLYKEGYRVWYDSGIHPGSDWPEVIAQHLRDCEICIVFLSENSMMSHNCRREINFAVLKKKKMLVVYLEDVELMPGMEMQLSTVQAVMRKNYDSLEEMVHKMLEMEGLAATRGEKPDIPDEPKTPVQTENEEASGETSDKEKDNKSEENKESDQNSESNQSENPKKEMGWGLYRKYTQQTLVMEKPEFRVGRQSDKCDYAILGNDQVSRVHAIFYLEDGELKVKDNKSTNKTYVNGVALAAEEKKTLQENDVIRIGGDHFMAVRVEITKESVEDNVKKIYELYRPLTDEHILVTGEVFKIGKSPDKNNYAILNNPYISRQHAVLLLEESEWYIMDNKSVNHTYVNQHMLAEGEKIKLKAEDQIRLYNEIFILKVKEN